MPLFFCDKFINGCTINHGCSNFSQKVFLDYFLTESENKAQRVEIIHTGPPTTGQQNLSTLARVILKERGWIPTEICQTEPRQTLVTESCLEK